MSNFKLAVITINRNNAEGLRKTIESVLSQPNLPQENFEYIIVDGASTDGSVEVIKEFETRTDLPLKITSWTSEPDTGIYNAMNKGIKKATGTLIQMLNSGDWLCEDVLARVFKKHIEMPDTILYGAMAFYSGDDYERVGGRTYKELNEGMIPHEAAFVPTKVYNEYGLYDESYKIAGDYDAFIRFYVNGVKFYFTNLLICDFDTSGISSVTSGVKEAIAAQKKYGVYKRKKFKFTFRKVPHYFKKLFFDESLIICMGGGIAD